MDSIQAIIEIYKRDLDLSLIKENLKLTHEQRLRKMQAFVNFAAKRRRAGDELRKKGEQSLSFSLEARSSGSLGFNEIQKQEHERQ